MRRLYLLLAFALTGLALCGPARAVEAVRVSLDSTAVDLTSVVERFSGQGDRIQISTAPGTDGIVRRIEVGAKQPGTKPNWIVFALTNDSDEQIERLLVAPHFRMVGSGIIWPDLGANRLSAITASQGFPPEAQDDPEADVFRVTLDPGSTVTYVAELRTPNLPQLYLWAPDAFKDQGHEPQPLQGHRHRHRRPAGAVPHHRVRGARRRHLPGRGRPRLGGAGLCVHRLRLLA